MSLAEPIMELLERKQTVGYLQSYFHGEYTGGLWDAAVAMLPPDQVGDADVAISSLLGMGVSKRGGRGRATPEGVRLSRNLASIAALTDASLDLNLYDLDPTQFDELLGDGSPLAQLWIDLSQTLKPGHNAWTLAYKVVAGKRPRLLPLRDGVVSRALNYHRSPWWRPMWEAVTHEGVVPQLMELRQRADVPDHVSVLRVLDASLWMWGEERPVSQV